MLDRINTDKDGRHVGRSKDGIVHFILKVSAIDPPQGIRNSIPPSARPPRPSAAQFERFLPAPLIERFCLRDNMTNRWSTEAYLIEELNTNPSYWPEEINDVYFDTLGYNRSNRAMDIGMLFLLGLIFRLVGLAGLKWKSIKG